MRWDDIPQADQRGGWWLAVPHSYDDGIDGCQFEVMYVRRCDGRFRVYRVGESGWRDVDQMCFLMRLELPETPREVEDHIAKERHRADVKAGVDKAMREMAEMDELPQMPSFRNTVDTAE